MSKTIWVLQNTTTKEVMGCYGSKRVAFERAFFWCRINTAHQFPGHTPVCSMVDGRLVYTITGDVNGDNQCTVTKQTLIHV